MNQSAVAHPSPTSPTRPPWLSVPHVAFQADAHLTVSFGSSGATFGWPGYAEPDPLTEEFKRLADRWRAETGHLSMVTQIVMHPAYQRIMTLGERVVPLILRDLRRRGGHWYWALRMITGQSPIVPADAGNVRAMKKAWLDWGEANGLLE